MYQTISIPKLLELVTFTDIFQLEKVIVEAAKRNNLQVFIHYLKNRLFDFVVYFENVLRMSLGVLKVLFLSLPSVDIKFRVIPQTFSRSKKIITVSANDDLIIIFLTK